MSFFNYINPENYYNNKRKTRLTFITGEKYWPHVVLVGKYMFYTKRGGSLADTVSGVNLRVFVHVQSTHFSVSS